MNLRKKTTSPKLSASSSKRRPTPVTAPRSRSASVHRADAYKPVLDAYPDPCMVIGRDGVVLSGNDRAVTIFSYNAGEIFPRRAETLVDPATAESLRAAIEESFRLATIRTLEAEIVTTGEISRYYTFTISPLRLPDRGDEEPIALLVAQDISELKARDLDLLRFSKIAYYTANPVEITDKRGRIIFVNPAFERASGYREEEVVGKNPNLFGSGKHPRSFWQNMWNTINAGKIWTGEVENQRRNGEAYYTNLLISPIIDGRGTIVGYFGVHRDITEQKNLQQQLIHAQKMESIGLLAAGIAHEVGNPLTSISSLVQIIQRTTHDDFTQEKLELVKSQISRISRIIRDLVDFSRRSSYEVQLTDINKNIREAVEIVRVGKKSKEIAFQIELSENIPALPLVPDQVEQVFINILINAVDAIHEALTAPDRPPAKKGVITVHSATAEASVVVTISDTGTGIREAALPKIFEPFYTTKRVGEGTGLGLWVSYGIIKSFQGTIQVSSVEGEGTTFTITLPLGSTIE
jgi:PAS domain S-box-containing protein